MPTRLGYSTLQIALHWTIAVLVLFQLFVNGAMSDAWGLRADGAPLGEAASGGAILHVVVGATVLLLAILRLVVRLRRGTPALHRDKPLALVWLAGVTHVLLYAFIIGMPITGMAAWFGAIESAADLHETARLILWPLILLHAAGALAEHFWYRNDSLVRMLRPR